MPDFDFGDFLNGIGQAKDNTLSGLGSVLRVLDKPRGAVGALLSGQDVSEGWNNPTSIRGRDYYGIRNIGNQRLRDIAGGAAEIILDPVNIIPAALPVKALKVARRVGPLAALLEPIAGTQAGVVKRLGAEVATGLSARLGATGAQAALDQTPLPEGIKTPLSLAAGFAGAGLTAGRFRPKMGNVSVARMTEEQINEPGSGYLDYIEELSNRQGKWAGVDENRRPLTPIFDSRNELLLHLGRQKEPIKGLYNSYHQFGDELQNEIARHTLPEVDVPIGDTANPQFIDRKVNILPANRAPIDPILDGSHEKFTTRFYTFRDTNPEADTILEDWITSSEGVQGLKLREAVLNADPAAIAIDSRGESWRQWAQAESKKGTNPFIQNGMVYLYRGERNLRANAPINQTEFPVASYTSDPQVAQNFTGYRDTNPSLVGLEESPFQEKFILGKWVPIDDVISPVGMASVEHEFLVMDRKQLSDAAYAKFRGTSKDIPLGTVKYAVINPESGETLKYVDTESEALRASQDSIEVPNAPVAYLVDTAGAKTIVEPQWKKNFEGIPGVKFTPIYSNLTKQYNRDIQSLSIGELDAIPLSEFVTVSSTHSVQLDYQPVTRGYKPEVTPHALDEDNYNTGMFSNPPMMGFAAETPKPVIQGPYGVTQGGKFLKNSALKDPLGGGSLIPVSRQEAFGGVGNLTPDEVNAAKQNIEANMSQLEKAVLGQNLPEMGPNGIMVAPPTATDAFNPEYLASNRPVHANPPFNVIDEKALPVGTPLEAVDVITLEQARQQIYAKLGVEKPTQDLIDLFIQGAVKAGKQDPNFIARGNNILRGMWATADGSWFGIQGLLTLPRLIGKGDFKDAADTFIVSMQTLTGNKRAFTKYLERVMTNLPEGAPNLLEAQKSGLHLAILQGNADFDFNMIDRLSKGHINPDAAFAAAGDIARISMFYNEWRRYGAKDGVTLEALSRAINRATGIAEKPFGGYIGTFALFAPRFFQSQLEVVTKALSDGSIEGMLARRQLGSLIGSGVMLSLAANMVRGYTSEEDLTNFFNPTHSNFMRVRDIAGEDISVFGPWDSLVKLVAHLGTGDIEYVRTKFSPLLTLAYNAMKGTTFMGDNFSDPATFARSLMLPFAWQDLGTGRETIPGQALGFFGVKSSTLSPREKREANMRNLGLDPDDPIQVRQYIAEHPEQVRPGLDKDEIKLNKVTQDIKQRAAMNDALTIGNAQTLVEFKDRRKLLNRERRNALSLLLDNQDFKADTQEKRWIQTYFDMLNSAQDPITHDINSDLVDNLESKWLADNGDKAYDYVQRYLLIDKNPAEKQYLEDMNQLRELGYFDKPKYTARIYKLTEGLSDDQIESYRDRVSAARFIDPRLGKIPFSRAARRVLTGLNLSNLQIAGIIAAGSDDALNPEVNRIKKQYPHLTAWNNPNLHFSDRLALEARTVKATQPIPTLAAVR